MLSINCSSIFVLFLLLSGNISAKPSIDGTYEDEVGKYDTPDIKLAVVQASKVCTSMFKGDFIIAHWLYAPNRDEIYLTGRTHGWLFYKEADCSYRPSNRSATGGKYPSGLNIMGEYEKFQTN